MTCGERGAATEFNSISIRNAGGGSSAAALVVSETLGAST
jgi:hypothetical protein